MHLGINKQWYNHNKRYKPNDRTDLKNVYQDLFKNKILNMVKPKLALTKN